MRFTKCEADGCNSIHWGQCVSGMSTVCIHVLLCTCGVVHASGTTEGNTFRYTPSSFFPLCWACMNTRVYSIVYNSGPIESYTATVYQSAGKKKQLPTRSGTTKARCFTQSAEGFCAVEGSDYYPSLLDLWLIGKSIQFVYDSTLSIDYIAACTCICCASCTYCVLGLQSNL